MHGATGVLTGYVASGFDLLSKERIVAGPAFNRWLVPPAARAATPQRLLASLSSSLCRTKALENQRKP